MNIIFDFGNVLVRWEPELVFLPYFKGNESQYWYFWRHVCNKTFRDRIDAGEDSRKVIQESQNRYPEYAEAINMYIEIGSRVVSERESSMTAILLKQTDGMELAPYYSYAKYSSGIPASFVLKK